MTGLEDVFARYESTDQLCAMVVDAVRQMNDLQARLRSIGIEGWTPHPWDDVEGEVTRETPSEFDLWKARQGL